MSHFVFNMFARKWECSIEILCILIDVKLISDIEDTIIDITDTSYDNFYDIDKNNLWCYFKISIFSPKNDQIHEISINFKLYSYPNGGTSYPTRKRFPGESIRIGYHIFLKIIYLRQFVTYLMVSCPFEKWTLCIVDDDDARSRSYISVILMFIDMLKSIIDTWKWYLSKNITRPDICW